MTGSALAWSPLVPLPLLLLLAGAALLLVAFAAWRGARGWWLRLLAAAALLLGLANPSLVEEQRQGLTDIALVLVDESASQDIGERRAQSEQALADLLARLQALPNTEVEVIRAGAGEDGTNLFAALRDALARLPRQQVAGVFLITDGQVHDVPDGLAALSLDAPVHEILTGSPDDAVTEVRAAHLPLRGAFRLNRGSHA